MTLNHLCQQEKITRPRNDLVVEGALNNNNNNDNNKKNSKTKVLRLRVIFY